MSDNTTPAGETHSADEAASAPEPTYPLLAEPTEPLRDVVTTPEALAECCAAVASGTGSIAIDAERASGYRYGNDAYLVQLRREGAGTWLIDPVACPDLSSLNDAIGDTEWVLHAATQDLPCLRELGLHPQVLFDTELGSRIAGLPRVGLAAVTEHFMNVTLAKEHSAVDWSTRPLPHDWLVYAALDVELLVAVRDKLELYLLDEGKLDWAQQEFDHLLDFTGPAKRTDPWRRTSGIHGIRDARGLARVKALWETRDAIARRRDTSPGRVLPDALIIDLAKRNPSDSANLVGPPAIRPRVGDGSARRRRPRPAHRGLARYSDEWLAALASANDLPSSQLPPKAPRQPSGPPPVRSWESKNPLAFERYERAHAALQRVSSERNIPIENLLTPDTLRRTIYSPPDDLGTDAWRAALQSAGARPWQCDIVAPILAASA